MYKDRLNYKLLNILIVIAIAFFIIQTYSWWSKVALVFVPFIISFVTAYAIYPCVRKLERKGVRHSIAIISILLIAVCLSIILFSIAVPFIYKELISLNKLLTDALSSLSTKYGLNILNIQSSISIYLNKLISLLERYISLGFVGFISKSLRTFVNALLIVISFIYFFINMEKIRKNVKSFLERKYKKVYLYVKEIDNEMSCYFEWLIISMLIHFIEYSFLFWIVGHPNWLLLGLLAAITTIVPYFGVIVTNIIAVILASAISTKLFIFTVLICLIFPNIDGFIISSKICDKNYELNLIHTIFILFIGGTLLGIKGLLIAIPLYLILRIMYSSYKEKLK